MSREDLADELDDIVLEQLQRGDWSAAGQMAEQVKKETVNFEELMVRMGGSHEQVYRWANRGRVLARQRSYRGTKETDSRSRNRNP